MKTRTSRHSPEYHRSIYLVEISPVKPFINSKSLSQVQTSAQFVDILLHSVQVQIWKNRSSSSCINVQQWNPTEPKGAVGRETSSFPRSRSLPAVFRIYLFLFQVANSFPGISPPAPGPKASCLGQPIESHCSSFLVLSE